LNDHNIAGDCPMKRYLGLFCLVIALIGAGFAGWVDFNNNEPQAAVLVILVFTSLLGFLQPSKAWLWAIVVALGLPALYLVATSLGYQPVSPPSPGWYASLLDLIPAFIGAYAGALGQVVINKAFVKS
jgi:hypothetical protein